VPELDPAHGATISASFGILNTDLKTVKTFLDISLNLNMKRFP
jgi:hypothetical protein